MRVDDWMVAGAAAGVIATYTLRVGGELFLYVTKIFPDLPYYEYVTQLMLPKLDMPTYVSVTLFLFSIIASSTVFGVLQAWIYRATGEAYLILKGVGYGIILAVIHIAFFPKLMERMTLMEQSEPWVIPWEIAVHIAWGAMVGYLYVWLRNGVEQRNRVR